MGVTGQRDRQVLGLVIATFVADSSMRGGSMTWIGLQI